MKILLTGSSGFIGSHLVSGLIGENHTVFNLNRNNVTAANGAQVIPIIGDRISVIQNAFSLYKFDCVIHAATRFQTQPPLSKLGDVIDSNITFGAELLKASIEKGAHFINFSSSWEWVKDGPKRQNIYRQSKSAFDDILCDSINHSGIKATSVVLSETYHPDDQREKVVPIIRRNVRAGTVATLSDPRNAINLDSPNDIVFLLGSLLEQNDWPRFIRPTPHVETTLEQLVQEVERLEQKVVRINWEGQFSKDLYRKDYFDIPAFFEKKPSIQQILRGLGSL